MWAAGLAAAALLASIGGTSSAASGTITVDWDTSASLYTSEFSSVGAGFGGEFVVTDFTGTVRRWAPA